MNLIDKDALVAEIDKRIEEYKSMKIDSSYYDGMIASLEFLRDEFIDSLEVKEVDLEKEIKEVQRNYKTIEEYEGYPCTMYANDIEWIAKHFFELGIQVSNKAEKDFELSWDDLKTLDEISDDVYAECDVKILDKED